VEALCEKARSSRRLLLGIGGCSVVLELVWEPTTRVRDVIVAFFPERTG